MPSPARSQSRPTTGLEVPSPRRRRAPHIHRRWDTTVATSRRRRRFEAYSLFPSRSSHVPCRAGVDHRSPRERPSLTHTRLHRHAWSSIEVGSESVLGRIPQAVHISTTLQIHFLSSGTAASNPRAPGDCAQRPGSHPDRTTRVRGLSSSRNVALPSCLQAPRVRDDSTHVDAGGHHRTAGPGLPAPRHVPPIDLVFQQLVSVGIEHDRDPPSAC